MTEHETKQQQQEQQVGRLPVDCTPLHYNLLLFVDLQQWAFEGTKHVF
jgi:hypothetical protein